MSVLQFIGLRSYGRRHMYAMQLNFAKAMHVIAGKLSEASVIHTCTFVHANLTLKTGDIFIFHNEDYQLKQEYIHRNMLILRSNTT